jgi:hypothetical protein
MQTILTGQEMTQKREVKTTWTLIPKIAKTTVIIRATEIRVSLTIKRTAKHENPKLFGKRRNLFPILKVRNLRNLKMISQTSCPGLIKERRLMILLIAVETSETSV